MLSAHAGFVSDFSYLRGIVSDFPYLRGLAPAKHLSTDAGSSVRFWDPGVSAYKVYMLIY